MSHMCRKVFIGIFAILVFGASCSSDGSEDLVSFDAMLDGQAIDGSNADKPVAISSEGTTDLSLDIRNDGAAAVVVEHVRLKGELLDFVFLTYDTGVNERIAAGGRRVLTFPVDFFDLEGQANGLLRSQIELFDEDGSMIASEPLVLDARGNRTSTMSLFNILLAFSALALLVWNLVRMAQRALPTNRFVRGLRFLYSGLTGGLAISAAFSTLRVSPLGTFSWVAITLISCGVGFALGYVAPGGAVLDDELDDLEDEQYLMNDDPESARDSLVGGDSQRSEVDA